MNDVIKDWLKAKRVSLWADWDVTDDKELEQAAAWFQKELQSFQAFEYQVFVSGEHELAPDFGPPSPYTHESQLSAAGQLEDLGPDLGFRNDGLLAGGLAEYQRARDWVHEQIGEIFA
jgi:hypothetical protein